MRTSIMILITIGSIISSCEIEPICTTCRIVSYSYERIECGYAGQCIEIVDREDLGEFCDYDEIQELSKTVKQDIVLASSCGQDYLLKVRLNCGAESEGYDLPRRSAVCD